MEILYVKDGNGNWVSIPAFTGPIGPQGIPGEKGETGDSGVYVGSAAPTDASVNVWIDPEGGPNVSIANGVSF